MSEKNNTLCGPDAAQSFGDTDVVGLELVQADGGGESERTQQPVAGSAGLGHTRGREVVDNCGPSIC
jgi:hypothetical protein